MNLKDEKFKLLQREEFAESNVPAGCSLIEIFDSFLDEELLTEIWQSIDKEEWDQGSDGYLSHGNYSARLIYVYFACCIRIMAEGRTNFDEERPLRGSITRALNNLEKDSNISSEYPKAHSLQLLFNRFHISIAFLSKICENFRKSLAKIGTMVAGDEKLYHFTGDSALIRVVISKPDRIGLWFYELSCLFKDNSPYLLDTFVNNSCVEGGIKNPVVEVVKHWVKTEEPFFSQQPEKRSILLFDSYYTSKDSIDYLIKNHIDFIGAVSPHRFPDLVDYLIDQNGQLSKAGESSAIINDLSDEILVHHYDMNSRIGKRYVLSNAFKPARDTRSLAGQLPLYDDYHTRFSICDRFNRGLNRDSFPHKTGGKNRKGEDGVIHKFILVVIMKNIHSLAKNLPNSSFSSISFRAMCLQLSVQLFKRGTQSLNSIEKA